MPKSIVIKKNGGPEVLELQDVNVASPGADEIKVTNHAISPQIETIGIRPVLQLRSLSI